MDGVPRCLDVFEEDGFNYRPADIAGKLGEKVKGIMINSPSNPTGIVMTDDEMRGLVDVVGRRAYVISDEIYHGLVYRGREHSILEYTDHAFVLNGFSKLYAMTGWRLGYIISPPDFVRPIQKIQQNLLICANSFVQWAGVAALEETAGETAAMVRTYDERRRFLLGKLREMGFGVAVALFLDATVVRSVVLPSVLSLLGDRCWYLPRWLAWLPRVEVSRHPQAAELSTDAA